MYVLLIINLKYSRFQKRTGYSDKQDNFIVKQFILSFQFNQISQNLSKPLQWTKKKSIKETGKGREIKFSTILI